MDAQFYLLLATAIILPAAFASAYFSAAIRAPQETGRIALHAERCGARMRGTWFSAPFVRLVVYDDCVVVCALGRPQVFYHSTVEYSLREGTQGVEVLISPHNQKEVRIYMEKQSKAPELLLRVSTGRDVQKAK